MNDSQTTKNLIIFFIVIAVVTFALGVLGYYLQEADYRKNLEQDNRNQYSTSEPT